MKREMISLILSGIDDRHITETASFAPETVQSSPERAVLMKRKRMISVALAAALMLSLGIAAYAIAGIPSWTVTHNMDNTGEYTDLESVSKIEEIVGYDVCLVDRFSTGFAFSKLRVDGEAAVDDEGTILREYYTVNAVYSTPQGAQMTLSLTPLPDLPGRTEPRETDLVRMIGGTEVRIYRDHYKFVPEDYKKTAEDLAAEESGHYFISFGAEETEEKDIVSADVVLGNTVYTFFFENASECSDDMLFRMAEEEIEACKASAK